jgi:acetolactate decarboxylase
MMEHAAHCLELVRAVSVHSSGGNGLHDDAHTAHELYQASTMLSLLDAVYDGTITYGELERHGDFGVGTFNQLDGEMVALDGSFFHLRSDGSAGPVDPSDQTPFAVVTFFEGDWTATVDEPATKVELQALLEDSLPTLNLFYALRIDGQFSSVTTRTVAKQTAPYKGLVEATESQSVQEFVDVAGSMVGIRAPDYAQGMTVAGYHFHFIDDARSRGGHVLDFTLTRGSLSIDQDAGFHVELPQTPEVMAASLAEHDIDTEIAAAEGGATR